MAIAIWQSIIRNMMCQKSFNQPTKIMFHWGHFLKVQYDLMAIGTKCAAPQILLYLSAAFDPIEHGTKAFSTALSMDMASRMKPLHGWHPADDIISDWVTIIALCQSLKSLNVVFVPRALLWVQRISRNIQLQLVYCKKASVKLLSICRWHPTVCHFQPQRPWGFTA